MATLGQHTRWDTVRVSLTMSWLTPPRLLEYLVPSTAASRLRNRFSRRPCRKLSLPWKSQSPVLRSFRCISCASGLAKMSRWLSSGKVRTNYSVDIIVIWVFVMAHCGVHSRTGCARRLPQLSQRYRETKCSSAVSGPWVLQTGCAGTRMFYLFFRAPRLTSYFRTDY